MKSLFDFISADQRDKVIGKSGLTSRLPRHVYSDRISSPGICGLALTHLADGGASA